jgi:hypothetical protein
LGDPLDITPTALKSRKGRARGPDVQGLAGKVIVIRQKGAVNIPVEWPDAAVTVVNPQQFPLSLQAQCSPGELHWPFVNFDATIPPD